MDFINAKLAFLRQDSILQRVILNTGWLIGSNTITAGLLFLQAIIMTRALGVERYGVLVLVTTYALTISQFIDSRLWEAVIKFVPQFRESGETKKAAAVLRLFYYIDGIASIIIMMLIFVTADVAAHTFFKDPSASDLLKFYSLAILINFSSETSSALLRVHDRFDWLSYHKVGAAAIKTVGVLIVWLGGASIELMLLSMLITTGIGEVAMLLMVYLVARDMKIAYWSSAPIKLLRDEYSQIFAFIFSSNLVATNQLLTSKIDVLFLGWLGTPTSVGLYELARRLVRQISSLVSRPIANAIYPEISKAVARKEYEAVIGLQRKFTRFGLLIMVGICTVGSLLAIIFIPQVFGEEFAPSVTMFQILIWSLLAISVIWFPGFMLSIGRAPTFAVLVVFTTIIHLVLMAFLVPIHNGVGAAIAFIIRTLIWIVLAHYIANHYNRALQADISEKVDLAESATPR